jgi:hypothetical protein
VDFLICRGIPGDGPHPDFLCDADGQIGFVSEDSSSVRCGACVGVVVVIQIDLNDVERALSVVADRARKCCIPRVAAAFGVIDEMKIVNCRKRARHSRTLHKIQG